MQAKELTIGVLTPFGAEAGIARWQATADYLSDNVDSAEFKIRPYTNVSEMAQAARRGSFDYAITNPSSYVEMEVNAGASKQLSLVNEWQGAPITRFGSVVFTSKKNADVITLRDLRGKNMMAFSKHAFGGWQTVKEEFAKLGIAPKSYLGSTVFSGGSQSDIVFAIRDGRADVGVVRTGVLEKMTAAGQIDLNDFHVVASRSVPGFPFLLSTDLYPEWYFAELPQAPEDLSQTIETLLLNLSPQDHQAVTGAYFGWRQPLSDQGVHLMLKSILEPPFENFGAITVSEFLWLNKLWLILVALILAGLLIVLTVAAKRSSQLSNMRGEMLKILGSELGMRNRALDEHAIVSIADKSGIIREVNDKFVEISGYSRNELIGKTHRILKSGSHDAQFYVEMWKTIKSGKIWNGEFQNRRKDGSFYWVQSTIVPHIGDGDKPSSYLAVRTDITFNKMSDANNQLAATLELAHDEVYMFWPDSLAIFYVNSTALEVMDLPKEVILKMTANDLAIGVELPRLQVSLQSLVQGDRRKLFHKLERRLPNGTSFYAEATIEYITPEVLPPRFILSIRDVSEQEIAIKDADQLRATLDRFADEIYMFWPDTKKFFFANETAKSRLGLTDDEIFQKTPTDLIGGLSEDDCASILAPMISDKTTNAYFVRAVILENGKKMDIEYEIQYITPEGQKPRFIAVLRDVTERETALHGMATLSSSLDLIQDEVYIFWPDTYEFVYLNKQALQRTGFPPTDWKGKRTNDRISSGKQAELEHKCRSLINGEKKYVVYEVVTQDKQTLEVYLYLVEPKGENPRFLAIYRDISERKEVDRKKSEFTSTVSHELRTPLTSIKGALGLIQSGMAGELPPKVSKLIDLANKNSDQLALLVNDILDLDKIPSELKTENFERLDMVEILRDALETNSSYGAEYGVEFSQLDGKTPLYVKGNAQRLHQVLANLLSNAAKFSEKGGVVKTAISCTSSNVRVEIKDDGCGIPENARATLYDRFTQVDSSNIRAKGGTGLGLSIAKLIIECHDGTIDFISKPGKGTTFFFELPLAA